MSDFKKAVPHSIGDLQTYLTQVKENQSHVRGVAVNPANSHLEIQLDWGAHMAGYPDVYMPIKHAKVNDAKALVEKMVREIKSGYAASDTEARQLFDMIDQQAG